MKTVTQNGHPIARTVDDFLFHCRYEKNLTPKTLTSYSIDLKQFQDFLRGSHPVESVEEIDRTILKEYIRSLSRFKIKTVKRKVASLKAMFNYLGFENDDFVNPFHKIKISLREANVLPTVMNVGEVQRILSLLYEQQAAADKKLVAYRAAARDTAVIELLFATGIRVSELCNLRTQDVHLREGYIKVFGKGRKERLIQLCGRETLVALHTYYTLFKGEIARLGRFFINRMGRPLTTQSVRELVHKYARSAGLEKRVTPHTFRHTFATLLLEESVDIRYIQSLLGHSSITTTQLYTHVNMEKQKQILNSKHPRRLLRFSAE